MVEMFNFMNLVGEGVEGEGYVWVERYWRENIKVKNIRLL